MAGGHWVGGEESLTALPRLTDERDSVLSINYNRLGRRDRLQSMPANVKVLKGVNGTTVFRSSIGYRVTESGPID
jgi:hypothetical protein